MGKKVSLILEGGGMRGAYTAGCLSWLIDEGIEFDGAYGISTGAVHLTTYLFKNKEWLKIISTEIFPAKDTIGIPALLKEGQIVAYNHMFSKLVENLGFDLKNIKTNIKAKIGLYDLDKGETIFINKEEINQKLLVAACSLPLLGKVIKENNHKYLDGGISKMIPIEKAIEDGYDKHLIIATKPLDFVRKPANGFVVKLMKLAYPYCKNISKDYKVRHLNYKKQLDIIKNLVNSNDALYCYPTGEVKVTRLGGSKSDLVDLYNMGYQDMEKRKEEIYRLVK